MQMPLSKDAVVPVLTVLVLLLLLLLLAVRRKNSALRKELAEQKLLALNSRIDQHFIFNSLNSVLDYIVRNETEAAHRYIARFAALIRLTMQNSEKKLVSLGDEIRSLEQYIELESMRFDGEIYCHLYVSRTVERDQTMIPAMIIQPYIENSIKHAFRDREGPALITIKIEREGGFLKCTISDNGIGRRHAGLYGDTAHHSRGMTITKKRIELINMLYRKNAGVEVIDLLCDTEAAGTQIIVRLPYISQHLHTSREKEYASGYNNR